MTNQQLIERFKEANTLANSGKFNEALSILLELRKEQPKNNVAVLLGIAQCLAGLSHIEDALVILEIILNQMPIHPKTVLMKTKILSANGKFQKAIQFLETKINSGLNDPEGFACLGTMYHQEHRFNKAILNYNKALGFSTLSDRNAVITNLATCYYEISDYKKAIKIYDEVLKANPDDYEVLFNKALVLKRNFNASESLKILKRVIRLQPEFLKAWINLSVIFAERRAKEKFKKCSDKIIELIEKQNKCP